MSLRAAALEALAARLDAAGRHVEAGRVMDCAYALRLPSGGR